MADPKIKFDIEANAEGAPSVEQLARRLDELGKSLDGELAASARDAGQALRQALAGNEAMAGATALRTSVTEAQKALRAAESDLKAYRDQMAAVGPPTQEVVAGEQRLAAAVERARQVLAGKRSTLDAARAGLSQYGLASTNAGAASDKLGTAIRQAEATVNRLDPAFRGAGAAAQQSAAQQSAAAARSAGAWERVKASIANFTPGAVVANVITKLIGRVGEMGRAFVQANVQIDGMRRAFNAIYKDAGLAESQIAFLRKTSTQAGVSFSALGDSFKTFAAAAHGANIPISVTNDLFASVTQASATLGLSGERTSLVLQALGQMASKGTVSMEELRQQLGESLPGALSLSAKGLGLTEAELIKLVETGGLAARDLFPALAQSLKTMQGENTGLQGSWERLKTAINGAMTAIGDAGGIQVMTVAVKGLGLALGAVAIPAQGLVEMLLGMGRAVGAAAASIAILTDGSTTWAQKSAQLREVGTALVESFDQADARMRSTAGGFAAIATGSDRAGAAMQATAAAAGTSTAAAAQYAQQWIGIGQTMREAAAEQDRAAANSTKLAQAADAEGKAMVALVALRGNATASAQAEAAAAASSATALQAVATARAKQLEIVQAELTAKQNLIDGNAAEQKAREQEIKTLTDKVEKLNAESAAATQAAEAARNGAVAKQAVAEATQDHTGKIAQFTAALQASTATVREYERLQIEGKKTAEDVAEAKREQALAESRLRDALNDSLDSLRARNQLEAANMDLARASLQADLELARTAEQRARLQGNEYAARQALIQQREIELKIAAAEVEASIQVANAKIAEIQANAELLRSKGELTAARQMEIDASIKAAQAQIMLANARKEGLALQAEEIQKLRSGIISVQEYDRRTRQAGETTSQATRHMRDGWAGVGQSIGKANQELAEYQRRVQEKYGRPGEGEKGRFEEGRLSSKGEELGKGVVEIGSGGSQFQNKDGWSSDAKGNVIMAKMDQALFNQRLAALYGEDMIGNANAEAAFNLKRRIDLLTANSFGEGDGSLGLLRKELERLTEAMERDRAAKAQKDQPATRAPRERNNDRPSSSGVSAGRPSGSSISPRNYVSNFNFPDQSIAVRTSDAASQAALQDVISRLTDAKWVAI